VAASFVSSVISTTLIVANLFENYNVVRMIVFDVLLSLHYFGSDLVKIIHYFWSYLVKIIHYFWSYLVKIIHYFWSDLVKIIDLFLA
jgi:hypothetical protein